VKLFVLVLVIAASAWALTPGIPVQSGSTILTPEVDSDGGTVFLLTTTDSTISRFIVDYDVPGGIHKTRVASRTGTTIQSLATMVIDSPLASITNVTVTPIAASAHQDHF